MSGWIAVTISGQGIQRHEEKSFRIFLVSKKLKLLEKITQDVKWNEIFLLGKRGNNVILSEMGV